MFWQQRAESLTSQSLQSDRRQVEKQIFINALKQMKQAGGHREMRRCLGHHRQGASLLSTDLNKVPTLLLTTVTWGHQEKV